MPHPNSSPTQHLTALYITSLGLVAGLAIAGQVLVRHILAQQADDLQIVSLLQQEQVLCQKISKNALAFRLNPLDSDRQTRQTELENTLTEWQQSRDQISRQIGNLQGDAELIQKMTALEPSGKAMVASAKAIVADDAPPARPRDLRLTQTPPKIPTLLQAERTFMQQAEQAILMYNQQAQTRVDRLKTIEAALLGITLVVLVLEGWFIFRPAVQKIQAAVAALTKSLQETQTTADKLAIEQAQSQRLLLNVLPEPIAERLKTNQCAIADGFAEVTVLFADIVGFTELSARLSPHELVDLLNQIFSSFDQLAEQHGLEKIKTIGDAYMVVGGLPMPRADHATAIADMALDMQRAIVELNAQSNTTLSMRIGINTGAVVAGVIGIKKFIYDLWGDTVNIASRMESHSLPGRIQITEATYKYLQDQYQIAPRGTITIKGRGEMKTYWLKAKR
jgi:adenylate cyclase